MRKSKGKARPRAAAGELRGAMVVVGVRTRSRSSAAMNSKRRRHTWTGRVAKEALRGDVDGGAAGCYLHHRSRRLFMSAAAVVAAPRGRPESEESSSALAMALADSGVSGDEVMAGVSRCSSTASSVDVVAVTERSADEAEACERRDVNVEKSAASDSGSGRERRETTPSSDVESSRRSSPTPTTTSTAAPTFHAAAGANTPPPASAEIEEFFAAAEKAVADRFAARYNFDVQHGVPLGGGRFEWTPAGCG